MPDIKVLQPGKIPMPRVSRGVLTKRETQIMVMLLNPINSPKIICKALNITDGTYKNHVNKIYSKLGALNRYHAILIFINTDGYQVYKDTLAEKPQTIYEIDDPEIRTPLKFASPASAWSVKI